MMKVLIVEDDFIVADYLKTIIEKTGAKVLGMVDCILDAKELIKQRPDLCMVDIRLANGDNGIDLGIFLKEINIPFIYLTANNEIETIKKAVKTNPKSYLTKPFNERDVIAAIELFKEELKSYIYLEIKTPKGKIKLDCSQILYCEADNVYSKIVTSDTIFTERLTLKELEEKLNDDFIRVHRSFLVNKNHISSYTSSCLLINEIEIPLSKSFDIKKIK